ncbi:MAG: hypothetical protein OXO52_07860 [Rhodospirillales bacterium]|nr:hypothetical protein [Rhodospirillales bacterium]
MTNDTDISGAAARNATPGTDAAEPISFGEVSAHIAFQREIAAMLADADITEEQRQQFLIAASCPCCGAGGLSLSLSLKPGATPKF